MYLWGLFGPSYGLYLLTIRPLNEDPNKFYYTSMMVATLKGGIFFLLGLSCKTYRSKCHHNTKTKIVSPSIFQRTYLTIARKKTWKKLFKQTKLENIYTKAQQLDLNLPQQTFNLQKHNLYTAFLHPKHDFHNNKCYKYKIDTKTK